MILNIFGPSGSGKTTLIKKLLKKNNLQYFFKSYVPEYKIKRNNQFVTSLSLIPLPSFRGPIKEFLATYSLKTNDLFTLNNDLKNLLITIINPLEKDNYKIIKNREVETLSAGEMRRFFILKSLLLKADIFIIDEPFSNSDKMLWETIIKTIANKKNSIVISHLPVDTLNNFKGEIIKVDINKINKQLFNI